jgi:uncharacterized protein
MNAAPKNSPMSLLVCLLTGFVFGLGLLISGMANPAKVIAFLDLSQAWDPSLALVMAGAIGVGLPGFTLAKRRKLSLLGERMQIPNQQSIDSKLLLGAALFGLGWGIAGFCPGPALVAASALLPDALVFMASMLAGMFLFTLRKPG